METLTDRKIIAVTLICLLMSGAFFTSHAYAVGLKKVVAVSRFENKSSWSGDGQWNIGSGLADQLTDALMQSNQFVVLERITLEDVINEQNLANSGRANKSKSAQTGKLVNAQVLITGTVTEFDSQSRGSSTGLSFGGFNLGGANEVAHIGLILRLIDATTGEVLASERVEGKAKSSAFNFGGSTAGMGFGSESFNKTPIGKATQITIDNAVEAIASHMRVLPFQGRVVNVKRNTIYVSAGTRTGASVGDVFSVISRGSEVVDPSTGERLGFEEKSLGKLELFDVKEKYSMAKPVGTLKGIKSGDIIRSH